MILKSVRLKLFFCLVFLKLRHYSFIIRPEGSINVGGGAEATRRPGGNGRCRGVSGARASGGGCWADDNNDDDVRGTDGLSSSGAAV